MAAEMTWCWTENEPANQACGDHEHDVRLIEAGVRPGPDERASQMSTSAKLRETQRALAASQADLTATRGRVVDLLYIIDAFQIESGADREASYATGIEAVRQLRTDRDRLKENEARWAAEFEYAENERDLARAELASVDAAAKRDIAKPTERLVDRVADLLRGRTEATTRALELAAELASARQELDQLRGRA